MTEGQKTYADQVNAWLAGLTEEQRRSIPDSELREDRAALKLRATSAKNHAGWNNLDYSEMAPYASEAESERFWPSADGRKGLGDGASMATANVALKHDIAEFANFSDSSHEPERSIGRSPVSPPTAAMNAIARKSWLSPQR